MRYLKQFSQWKDKKSKDISEKVNQLNYQTQLLAQTKQEQNVALNKQLTVNKKLENQYAQQDAIVTELKRNGDALRSHLARKQAEANELKSRIASVIAQEQKRADEQRRAEEQRKAEEKRLADERAAKKAEADRLAEEKRKDAEKETKNLASNTSKKQAEKKEQTKVLKENKKEQTKDNKKEQQKNKDSKEYASARKRNPRSDNSNTAKPAAPTSTASADVAKNNTSLSSFESAKGSLPKPVSGSFRVTSPFGKHPLPDLPDVVYDNPGIDAEVSSGASASAVFAGKVSGVYVIAGYQTVIIVNHGTYYTVYGNIASPSVSVGSVVKQGQTLGKLATDPDNGNRTSIHFEVWKNREKLNPLEWIR
jgi:septal ring factor EnvC (AmiA/AmiB activator)